MDQAQRQASAASPPRESPAFKKKLTAKYLVGPHNRSTHRTHGSLQLESLRLHDRWNSMPNKPHAPRGAQNKKPPPPNATAAGSSKDGTKADTKGANNSKKGQSSAVKAQDDKKPGKKQDAKGQQASKVQEPPEEPPKRPDTRTLIGGASWTGKLPVNLLSEHCQKQHWQKPEYTMVRRCGGKKNRN